jgi:hypothetical protein
MAVEGGIITYPEMRANHEEGDSRVWLHASKSGASKVIIYSPDTDCDINKAFCRKQSKKVFLPQP